jgi:lipoate synthase
MRGGEIMSQNEQNVAILKRLREMLVRQREKFDAYLRLLERQKDAIAEGDTGKLLAQVEMEREIIAEVKSLRKVIAPLETLYQAAYPGTENTVPRLKATLETMSRAIAAHNARNRQMLRDRMEELRHEITALRAWPRTGPQFADVSPNLIDITT